MSSELCDLFTDLSYYVWDVLGHGRQVKHQVGEESITDLLMLVLKGFAINSKDLEVFSFNKYQEGNNKGDPFGADWEIWFTDSKNNEWIGFRVQAKIINYYKDRFNSLHYNNGKQTSDLEKSSRKHQLTPLYCLYIHADMNKYNLLPIFGCSLLLTSQVNKMYAQNSREWEGLIDVINHLKPIRSLVCNDNSCNNSKSSLPNQIDIAFKNNFPKDDADIFHAGVINNPPDYVFALMERGEDIQAYMENLETVQNIIILKEKNNPK